MSTSEATRTRRSARVTGIVVAALAAIVTGALAAGPAPAQEEPERVALRLDLAAGDRLVLDITRERSVKARGAAVSMFARERWVIAGEVVQVRGDGTAEIRCVYTRTAFRQKDPLGTWSVDTGDRRSVMAHEDDMGAVPWLAVQDEEFTCVVAPDGTVRRVQGHDMMRVAMEERRREIRRELNKKVEGSEHTEGGPEGMRYAREEARAGNYGPYFDPFRDEYMQAILTQVLSRAPGETLTVGSSWTERGALGRIEATGEGEVEAWTPRPMRCDLTHTLQELDERRDNPVAVIAVAGVFSDEVPALKGDGADVLDGAVKGDLVLHATKGLPLEWAEVRRASLRDEIGGRTLGADASEAWSVTCAVRAASEGD